MCDTPCSFTLRELQYAVITTPTGRRLVSGPKFCACFWPCFEEHNIRENMQLDPDEVIEIKHRLEPEKSRYLHGPDMAIVSNPWEDFSSKEKCKALDQDDYLIVRSKVGDRSIVRGPRIYKRAEYGDTVVGEGQAILCPVNNYLIVNDADSTDFPVVHVPGPTKWYPKPFQTLTKTKDGRDYHPCECVRGDLAVHLQRASGEVIILDKPQYYMPAVGEKVVTRVKLVVLLTTDFCIIKSPSGGIKVKAGTEEVDRAFFLQPFEKLVQFDFGGAKKTVLSTLPTFLPHQFNVRTSDNVILALDMRICFRISDVATFSSNPIDFYSGIRNHVQNNLLDKFSKITLSQFMNSFGTVVESEVGPITDYFRNFGLEIVALQMMNYNCENETTQKLLWEDIHTQVKQNNELRAKQTDVYITEQINEVQRKQKELEVALTLRDNEIRLQRKTAENHLRIKEMEIEINEELKKTELLEQKRNNDLIEAEFEGRARGHELSEFLKGVDPSLTAKQKLAIFERQCDLKRSGMLYGKAEKMIVYPTNVDVQTYQLGDASDIHKVKSREEAQQEEEELNRGKLRWKAIQERRENEKTAGYVAKVSGGDIMPGMAALGRSKDHMNVSAIDGMGTDFRDKFQQLMTEDASGSEDENMLVGGRSFGVTAKTNEPKTMQKLRYGNEGNSDDKDPAMFTKPVVKFDEEKQKKFKNEGNVCFAKKLYKDAIDNYTAAIECGKADSSITIKCVSNRSLCLKMLGCLDEALDDVNTVLEYDSRDVKALARRMEIFGEMGKKDKELADALALSTLDKKLVGALIFSKAANVLKKNGYAH